MDEFIKDWFAHRRPINVLCPEKFGLFSEDAFNFIFVVPVKKKLVKVLVTIGDL